MNKVRLSICELLTNIGIAKVRQVGAFATLKLQRNSD